MFRKLFPELAAEADAKHKELEGNPSLRDDLTLAGGEKNFSFQSADNPMIVILIISVIVVPLVAFYALTL